MDENGIMQLTEQLIRHCFKKVVLDVELPDPLPRLSYHEADVALWNWIDRICGSSWN